MRINMGRADRTIRLVLAILIAVLYFTKLVTGTSAIILMVLSGIFLLTSMIGVCPLYLPFGFSTRRNKKQ